MPAGPDPAPDPAQDPAPAPGPPDTGAPDADDLDRLARRLFGIRRSLTGPGVRETLAVIGERVPLAVHEVPTGTPVLDWTVPREWTLREAWVQRLDGTRVIDAADHPLHVVGYSVPFEGIVGREELRVDLPGGGGGPLLVDGATGEELPVTDGELRGVVLPARSGRALAVPPAAL